MKLFKIYVSDTECEFHSCHFVIENKKIFFEIIVDVIEEDESDE